MRALALLLALALPASAADTLFHHGAVASGHEAASEVGAQVLGEGGNAVDAAVATVLAMGVARPDASGLGGGGFLVYRRASDGRVFALDFREKAPAAATRDMFVAHPQASTDGGLAVGVPGEVAGLFRAHREHGRLPWKQVVDAARDLAVRGPAITPKVRELLADSHEMIAHWPALAKRYGRVPEVGERLPNPPLAATLDALAREGADAFYHGRIARAIVRAVHDAGGALTEADLAGYQPVAREVVRGTYRGYELYSMPPPSSGGAVLIEILNVLDAVPGWPPRDPALYAHQLVEAEKHGFADRARWFGDPDFARVPVAHLIDPAYGRSLAARIGARPLALDAYGARELPADHGTSHFSVLDEDGNAVAVTSTINTEFGSKVLVPELGFPLNDEMDDFAAAPGVPNAFGLVQGEANAIAPGKRPLSSMSPTIVVRDGRVAMVAGASGGSRIITGTLQAILNVVHRGMSAQDAVAAPRVHHQWKPDSVRAEPEAGEAVLQGLERRGHVVSRGDAGSSVELLVVRAGGVDAGDDPRKGGKPAGPARGRPTGGGLERR